MGPELRSVTDFRFLCVLFLSLWFFIRAKHFSVTTEFDSRADWSQLVMRRVVLKRVNQEAATGDRVIRHRCANRLCINPAHLEIGSKADNKRDDWAHWSYGVDPKFL